jgi:hypothetical protein
VSTIFKRMHVLKITSFFNQRKSIYRLQMHACNKNFKFWSSRIEMSDFILPKSALVPVKKTTFHFKILILLNHSQSRLYRFNIVWLRFFLFRTVYYIFPSINSKVHVPHNTSLLQEGIQILLLLIFQFVNRFDLGKLV